MSAPVFVDTNILISADDSSDSRKQGRAQDLLRQVIRDRTGRLSIQVLAEYFTAATRKLGLDPGLARRRVELYRRLDVVLIEPVDLLGAIDLHRLYQFSLWDALILRAAIVSGCRVVYTEDLQPASGSRRSKSSIRLSDVDGA